MFAQVCTTFWWTTSVTKLQNDITENSPSNLPFLLKQMDQLNSCCLRRLSKNAYGYFKTFHTTCLCLYSMKRLFLRFSEGRERDQSHEWGYRWKVLK